MMAPLVKKTLAARGISKIRPRRGGSIADLGVLGIPNHPARTRCSASVRVDVSEPVLSVESSY